MTRDDRIVATLQLVCEEQRHAHSVRHAQGAYVADDADCPDVLRLAALAEELGEVARAVHDGNGAKGELIQLAGVAVAWASIL